MKNSASTFHTLDALEALRDPQIPSDPKTQVWRNVSWQAFCGIRTGTTKQEK
jgi:hypothetical protein